MKAKNMLEILTIVILFQISAFESAQSLCGHDIKNNPKSPFFRNGPNFKTEKRTVQYAFYEGKLFRNDDFGNFNYGVAGKAFGFSDFILEAGAGANQLTKSSSPSHGPKYFF